MRTFNSYRSLFRINFKIYEIGDKVLPFPIPLDTLLMSGVLFFPFYPFGSLFFPEFPRLGTFFISYGVSHVLSNFDLQGKFMLVFFRDLLYYAFRPKRTNLAGEKINRMNKEKLTWEMGEVID